MRKTVVLDVVGLTSSLLGDATPRLRAFAERGRVASITPVLPAVTCTAQATYLTGAHPEAHGIVGNGWYFRDECEVRFWRQSNKLVQQPKIWERARSLEPSFTCANLFWWFNMYSSADYSVTPRPMYPADGRKLPDVYTQPAELRPGLQAALGQFPLFNFWGPATSIRASRWIADAALWVDRQHDPTLTLIYLPHLDYCLQRLGPGHPEVAADLTAKYDARNASAIKRLVAAGAQLRPFSTDILDASFKATNELFAEVSAKNAKFKALYESTIAFRNEQYQWHQVCEATYDNYMIRRIRA